MWVNEQQAMGNKKPSQNWDDLRYFLAVARTGTLSAAAKQLGAEHTTVARHIQALEDELNSRLFPQEQQRLRVDRRGRTASGWRRGD
jgi:DNA-binding transcriptional LysR family regulator